MTEQELKSSIDNVRKLTGTALDNHERDLLGDLMGRIVKAHSGQKITPEEHESLHEQLDEQAVSFESRHPTIAKAIREVMDVLHKMGI